MFMLLIAPRPGDLKTSVSINIGGGVIMEDMILAMRDLLGDVISDFKKRKTM